MLQIIIPAAGRGVRFLSSEFSEPKPLIQWDGKNMIEHVVSNFKRKDNEIFILSRKEHCISIEGCHGKEIDYVTEGPAISAALFANEISMDDELIITNCDQIIRDWNQDNFLRVARKYDGVLGCFLSTNPHNSYAVVDQNNLVKLVKEKEVISNLSTNGLHYWKKARYFFESLKDMINNDDRKNGEFYIAPTYNYLISKSYRIGIFMFNEHFPTGTPDQLKYYLNYENIKD